MQTTKTEAMRCAGALVVMVLVMALGACGGDPLMPGGAGDVDAVGGAPGDAGSADLLPTAGALEGRWCSPSYGELDLQPGGAYVSILNGQETRGTWVSDGTSYLTFLGTHGEAGAVQTIVSLTATQLSLSGFSGLLTFERCH